MVFPIHRKAHTPRRFRMIKRIQWSINSLSLCSTCYFQRYFQHKDHNRNKNNGEKCQTSNRHWHGECRNKRRNCTSKMCKLPSFIDLFHRSSFVERPNKIKTRSTICLRHKMNKITKTVKCIQFICIYWVSCVKLRKIL